MNLELRLKEIKTRLDEIRGLVDAETDQETKGDKTFNFL